VEQKRFHCDVSDCGSSFSRKGSVQRHKKQHHSRQFVEDSPVVGDGVRNCISVGAVGQEANIDLVEQHEIKCGQPATGFSLCSTAVNSAKPCRPLPQTKDRQRRRVRFTCGTFLCDYPNCGRSFELKGSLAKHKTMMKHRCSERLETDVSEQFNVTERIEELISEEKGTERTG
jgi:hypothetical protein